MRRASTAGRGHTCYPRWVIRRPGLLPVLICWGGFFSFSSDRGERSPQRSAPSCELNAVMIPAAQQIHYGDNLSGITFQELIQRGLNPHSSS